MIVRFPSILDNATCARGALQCRKGQKCSWRAKEARHESLNFLNFKFIIELPPKLSRVAWEFFRRLNDSAGRRNLGDMQARPRVAFGVKRTVV
jgi:hypothetical protein